jgi:hypothetical protein
MYEYETSIKMLTVIMLNVMIGVIMLRVNMSIVMMLRVIMSNFIILSVIVSNFNILSVIMLSVIIY